MYPSKTSIIENAYQFIQDLFEKKGIDKLNFHNIQHTLQVVKAVDEIGAAMKIEEDLQEGLTLAAWFHDSGHIKRYQGHETASKVLAKEFLVKEKYPEEKILFILNCIDATKMPQQPKNLFEAVNKLNKIATN